MGRERGGRSVRSSDAKRGQGDSRVLANGQALPGKRGSFQPSVKAGLEGGSLPDESSGSADSNRRKKSTSSQVPRGPCTCWYREASPSPRCLGVPAATPSTDSPRASPGDSPRGTVGPFIPGGGLEPRALPSSVMTSADFILKRPRLTASRILPAPRHPPPQAGPRRAPSLRPAAHSRRPAPTSTDPAPNAPHPTPSHPAAPRSPPTWTGTAAMQGRSPGLPSTGSRAVRARARVAEGLGGHGGGPRPQPPSPDSAPQSFAPGGCSTPLTPPEGESVCAELHFPEFRSLQNYTSQRGSATCLQD